MIVKKKPRLVVLIGTISLVLVFMATCSKSQKADPREVALLDKIEQNPGDAEPYIQLMFLELIDLECPEKTIEIFESNSQLLGQRLMARIYHATAVCMMAGKSKSPADQLKYVREGIGLFDAILRDHPDDYHPYLYRAITYSNFPDILGVDSIVLSDIALLNSYTEAGTWSLETGERRILSEALLNLAIQYKKKAYLDMAQEQMKLDGLIDDPALSKLAKTAAGVVK